jgi:hypothetical protein
LVIELDVGTSLFSRLESLSSSDDKMMKPYEDKSECKEVARSNGSIVVVARAAPPCALEIR